MNFVCVDLGASSTRYRSSVTKGEQPYILPNNMVFLSPDVKKVDLVPYDSTIEMALEAYIEKTEGEQSVFPVHVLIGSLAERFNSTNERPSGDTHKYKQATTYVSAIMVTALSRIKENLGENLSLYVALPPIEVKTAKEQVIRQLLGKYIVRFPKYRNGLTVSITITEVNCYEEAYMASASYLFTLDGTLRPEAKNMLQGCVVSVDIGDSTTDLAIIKNGRYLEKSGQTYKVGGSIARAALCDRIREAYGYDLPIEEADRTMCEGRLQMGNTYTEIPDVIRASKRVLAQMIVDNMKNYFRLLGMPLQTMRAAIVSGGGSLASKYTTESGEVVAVAEPMSDYITEYMSEICPGLLVVPYGDNARIANVNGLALKAKMDEVTRQAQAQNN